MKRLLIFLTALMSISSATGCVMRVRATPVKVTLPSARVVVPARVVVKPAIYLGSDSIHPRRLDRDQTVVCSKRERLNAFRLQVDSAPVKIRRLHVVLDGGEVYKVPIKTYFRRGERSHWIDLPGRHRRIKRIVVLAESADPRRLRRAKIRYYGRG